MIPFSLLRTGATLLLAGVTVACGAHRTVASTEPVAPATSTRDRMTVRTGDQVVVVDSPVAGGASGTCITTGA